jgi:hypothetical protein
VATTLFILQCSVLTCSGRCVLAATSLFFSQCSVWTFSDRGVLAATSLFFKQKAFSFQRQMCTSRQKHSNKLYTSSHELVSLTLWNWQVEFSPVLAHAVTHFLQAHIAAMHVPQASRPSTFADGPLQKHLLTCTSNNRLDNLTTLWNWWQFGLKAQSSPASPSHVTCTHT